MSGRTAFLRRFVRSGLTLEVVFLVLSTSFAATRFEHPSVLDVFWHWGGIAVAKCFRHIIELFEVWVKRWVLLHTHLRGLATFHDKLEGSSDHRWSHVCCCCCAVCSRNQNQVASVGGRWLKNDSVIVFNHRPNFFKLHHSERRNGNECVCRGCSGGCDSHTNQFTSPTAEWINPFKPSPDRCHIC